MFLWRCFVGCGGGLVFLFFSSLGFELRLAILCMFLYSVGSLGILHVSLFCAWECVIRIPTFSL